MCIYYLSADMAGDLGGEGNWEGKIGKKVKLWFKLLIDLNLE